jgi:hypothetical protein
MNDILRNDTIYTTVPEGPSEINIGRDNKWIIKLTSEGIFFNHEEFPNLTADDFVKEFIQILETNFRIRFEPKDDLK